MTGATSDQPREAEDATKIAAGVLRCDILTLFPDFFGTPLQASILKRALESGALEVGVHDIRAYTVDKHRTADDTPYGGGPGMVMKPEPVAAAIEAAEAQAGGRAYRILMTPQGKPLNQARVKALSEKDRLMLICGRYEGVDERVKDLFIDEELSIGDYVLSGGEMAALVVLDAVTRLRPGVLGNAASVESESFSEGLLEYPQYTRPATFRGLAVPEVLISGDHGKIASWRRGESLKRTLERRPDLLGRALQALTAEDHRSLAALSGPGWRALLEERRVNFNE
jgi:tRNA (guanine37-N1)-methyltransferase